VMPAGFSAADAVLLLPELVIAAGALLILTIEMALPSADRVREKPRAAWLALGAIALALAALVPAAGLQMTVARGLIAVDGFALFFKVLFLLAAALTVLMSARYPDVDRTRRGEYYFLILTATLGMMCLAGGIDLITIFIGLETMAVSFYVLTGFVKWNRRSNEAAIKYFLLGTFSLGILLYGMSLLYGLSGTTHLRSIATAVASGDGGPMLLLAVLLLVAGLGFKIAAVPFHMWAPDVYEGAPTPVTAFLSVGSKAASFAMLLRIFLEGLPAFHSGGLGSSFGQPVGWSTFLYMVAVATMTVGNIAALTQANIKRMLAYSSVAHAGYVLIGVVAGTPRGTTAALIYLMVYVFMQLGAFAVVASLRRRDIIGDELQDLTGLYASRPGAALAMLLFMISLGGIPPTAGFMGKLWLFGAAVDAGYIWLAVIGVANSAVSLYYYLRVVVYMWIAEADGSRAPSAMPRFLTAAIALCVAGTLLFGLYPDKLFDFAATSARSLGRTPVVGLR
jgi:NADH-quinone oxidoreductase subunit N